MIRRILGNIVPSIDKLIERIPPHIRDIIQKASLAFGALLALLAIIAGVNKGLQDAKPVGFKAVERNRDLFYLQEMREEYAKKRKLVEDVEVDPLTFPSRQKAEDNTAFVPMGRDTLGHMMGEKDEMIKHEDSMRPKEKSPGYLGDSYQIPRLAPDKKAIEDDDAHLTKDKIGSAKKEPAPSIAPVPTVEKAPMKAQAPAATKGRDVFDDGPGNKPSGAQTDGEGSRRKAVTIEKAPTASKPAKNKMEFIE